MAARTRMHAAGAYAWTRIENCHVLCLGQVLTRGAHAFEVVDCAAGEERQFVDLPLDIRVDQNGRVETIAAMHDPVSHGLDAGTPIFEHRSKRIVHARDAFHGSLRERTSVFVSIRSGRTPEGSIS